VGCKNKKRQTPFLNLSPESIRNMMTVAGLLAYSQSVVIRFNCFEPSRSKSGTVARMKTI